MGLGAHVSWAQVSVWMDRRFAVEHAQSHLDRDKVGQGKVKIVFGNESLPNGSIGVDRQEWATVQVQARFYGLRCRLLGCSCVVLVVVENSNRVTVRDYVPIFLCMSQKIVYLLNQKPKSPIEYIRLTNPLSRHCPRMVLRRRSGSAHVGFPFT